MFDIYYAHHQWKYGTQIEAYELDLIREYFPYDKIFNPATDLKSLSPKLDEDSISLLVIQICLSPLPICTLPLPIALFLTLFAFSDFICF